MAMGGQRAERARRAHAYARRFGLRLTRAYLRTGRSLDRRVACYMGVRAHGAFGPLLVFKTKQPSSAHLGPLPSCCLLVSGRPHFSSSSACVISRRQWSRPGTTSARSRPRSWPATRTCARSVTSSSTWGTTAQRARGSRRHPTITFACARSQHSPTGSRLLAGTVLLCSPATRGDMNTSRARCSTRGSRLWRARPGARPVRVRPKGRRRRRRAGHPSSWTRAPRRLQRRRGATSTRSITCQRPRSRTSPGAARSTPRSCMAAAGATSATRCRS